MSVDHVTTTVRTVPDIRTDITEFTTPSPPQKKTTILAGMEESTLVLFVINIFNKHSRALLFMTGFLIVLYFMSRTHEKVEGSYVSRDVQRKKSYQELFDYISHDKPTYDVIVSSNMRSGSTFLSFLLGFRTDTFMFYEPFWSLAKWGYFRGDDTLCSSSRHACRSLAENEISNFSNLEDVENNMLYDTVSLRGKVDWTLNRIFQCRFDNFEDIIFDDTNARLADPSWNPYRNCRHQDYTKKECFPLLTTPCNRAKHLVIKVIRLTVDLYDAYLKQYPTLKVIQLFRDPRATINSRIMTHWYKKIRTMTDVRQNAASLCDRMLHDIKAGTQLLANHSERFRFILYEDLIDNVELKRRIVYDYLGMSHNSKDLLFENIHEEIHKNQHINQPSSLNHNFTAWWRTSIPWYVVEIVDKECSEIYDLLGYIKYESEEDLRNLSLPHVKTPYFSALDFKEVLLFD